MDLEGGVFLSLILRILVALGIKVGLVALILVYIAKAGGMSASMQILANGRSSPLAAETTSVVFEEFDISLPETSLIVSDPTEEDSIVIGRYDPTKEPDWKETELKITVSETEEYNFSETLQPIPAVEGDLMPRIYSLVQRFSGEYRVPPAWTLAVIANESNFQPNAVNVNPNGTVDTGLMQINSETAPFLADRLGIPYERDMEADLEMNIRMGTFYLHYLRNLDEHSEDLHRIFTSYNRGPNGAAEYYNLHGTYASSYSERVIEMIPEYEVKSQIDNGH